MSEIRYGWDQGNKVSLSSLVGYVDDDRVDMHKTKQQALSELIKAHKNGDVLTAKKVFIFSVEVKEIEDLTSFVAELEKKDNHKRQRYVDKQWKIFLKNKKSCDPELAEDFEWLKNNGGLRKYNYKQ